MDDVAGLHARIDRLEELLAWQLAAPALQSISMGVADRAVAEHMAQTCVTSMRQSISSREPREDGT